MFNYALENTDRVWNTSIVAQDFNLATEDLLSLIPGSDPILFNSDIELCEVDTRMFERGHLEILHQFSKS